MKKERWWCEDSILDEGQEPVLEGVHVPELVEEPVPVLRTGIKEPPKVKPTLRDKYKDFFGIRQTWAEQDSHFSSGMPTYMQKVVEGSEEEYEKESLNYCHLAGFKYKSSKEKMMAEIEALKEESEKILSGITTRLHTIVSEYKQMELA